MINPQFFKIYKDLQYKFGAKLKKIRTEKTLSLRELAARCDLDDSNISKIENGKVNIQLSTIFELAKGLGVEPKELLDF
jgi:transcriptional regulator with XRE-family HTH domain